MIIEKNRIVAAKCILPVSQNPNLPNEYGLRHRSGLVISETSDALVIIVSEQSGNISIAQNGQIHKASGRDYLQKAILAYLRKKSDSKKEHKAEKEANKTVED